MGQLGGLHQPPEEGINLGREAQLEEGVEDQGRVPDPAEAVVPVAHPADPFRKRRGGGGGDGPGRSEDEELEGEGAASHGLRPRTAVAGAAAPLPPADRRLVQATLDLRTGREHERLLIGGAQGDQRPAPRAGLEAAGNGPGGGHLRLTGAP